MHIGILKCDRVSEAFETEHGQYPEMFANLLRPVEPQIEFTVFDAEKEEFPENLDSVDAYLISGSRFGVNDDLHWIRSLEAFVAGLHQARKKVIGICFGHQLIAKVLGGRVIKSPKGWGVGISQNTMFQRKEWMSSFQSEFNLLVSHQDQVIELPAQAEVLAGSDFCPNYMMQIGNHLLTIQGHPEFTKAYSKALMVSREDQINEMEFVNGMASLALREDDSLIAQLIIDFIRKVC